MIRFGLRLTFFNLINHFVASFDKVVIGRFGGDHATGLYDRAGQLVLLPLTQVNAPLAVVAVPALSRVQNEPERLRNAYLRAVSLLMTVTTPLVVFMYLWAEQLIRLLLGAAWGDAVDLFRILAVAGLTRPLANTTGWLFIARGRVAAMLRWRLRTAWITPVFVSAGMYVAGVEGVAVAVAAVSIALTPYLVWESQRGTMIGARAVLRTAGRPLAAALITGVLLWPAVPYLHIVGGAVAVPVLFLIASCAMARSLAPVREIWALREAIPRVKAA
jgi:PST family polysaccharide transporter